jgi:hypothetical protein
VTTAGGRSAVLVLLVHADRLAAHALTTTHHQEPERESYDSSTPRRRTFASTLAGDSNAARSRTTTIQVGIPSAARRTEPSDPASRNLKTTIRCSGSRLVCRTAQTSWHPIGFADATSGASTAPSAMVGDEPRPIDEKYCLPCSYEKVVSRPSEMSARRRSRQGPFSCAATSYFPLFIFPLTRRRTRPSVRTDPNVRSAGP